MLFQSSNFDFHDLFNSAGIKKLDDDFLEALHWYNNDLYQNLLHYREGTQGKKIENRSNFIIELSKFLEIYLLSIFGISEEYSQNGLEIQDHITIFTFKNHFITKLSMKKIRKSIEFDFDVLNDWLEAQLIKYYPEARDLELSVAKLGLIFLKEPEKYQFEIESLVNWCVCLLRDPNLKAIVKTWMIFTLPKPVEPNSRIEVTVLGENMKILNSTDFRYREGFKLTDQGMLSREIYNQINNCMFCHKHQGDYCSKGFPIEKNSPDFLKNAHDELLVGCPLSIKISEMLLLKNCGHSIAALSVLMLDNPMCLLTGYRVCNDCMKSCIYQKQEPVHVPQIETKIVKDILGLSWGFEIYDLLTRWNPLLQKHWMLQPYNNSRILIIGAGPAGITMAHYLLREGCLIVIMDGLKIEPLPEHYLNNPIKSVNDLTENLDERMTWGFGGVAEYGITVRWDKNFLKLAYISLRRKQYFQIFGGVRFGGALTVEEAWKQNFDHLIIAVGAGLPRELPIAGSLAPGMRQANDFLMALHLNNFSKQWSLPGFQVRLPAIVIGGGLTAVDTATEVQAYYLKQIAVVLAQSEMLLKNGIEWHLLLSKENKIIIEEMITHAEQMRFEEKRALLCNEKPDRIGLIRQWGGVKIVYRKNMQNSPAYRGNHEELQKALEEGILYVENFETAEALLDQYGHIEALRGKNIVSNESQTLNARSVFIATGTKPNIAYAFEHGHTFEKSGFDYKSYEYKNEKLISVDLAKHVKSEDFGPFTSYHQNDKTITYIGDAHPLFHGSVVNAIASATRTYPYVMQAIKTVHESQRYHFSQSPQEFLQAMENKYRCHIVSDRKIKKNCIELVIKASQAASQFSPGQFYKLQPFEVEIRKNMPDRKYMIKPISAFPFSVDKERGLISFRIFGDNENKDFLLNAKPNMQIALTGPTGSKIKIPENERIVIFGDILSVSMMNMVGQEYKKLGNEVLYIPFLRSNEHSTDIDWLKMAHKAILITPEYHDETLIENLHVIKTETSTIFNNAKFIEAFSQLIINNQKLTELLTGANRVIIFGKNLWSKNCHHWVQQHFKNFFKENPIFFSSVMGPMQCMLKGICGQCLQWQIDPKTKKRTKAVFACSWQCQPAELIDFEHLEQRGLQNSALDNLRELWYPYAMSV